MYIFLFFTTCKYISLLYLNCFDLNNYLLMCKSLLEVDNGSNVVVFYNKIDKRHWSQELLKCACEAYLSLRKELSILLALHHPHIVPLVGVCLHPLSIILSLAPLGSLRSCLDNYRRLSHAFPSYAIRCVIIQVLAVIIWY